jgi:hypothetical protein
MSAALQRPARRTVVRVAIIALLVAAICWFFGADVWHSVLFGTVLTAVGLIVLRGLGPDVGTVSWRAAGSNRHGARRDVDQLSWAMRGSYGRVDGAAVWRVQRLAAHRLAVHQLDLQNAADRPRIKQLLGRRAYVLLARGERRPVSLRALLQCLDALDVLDALAVTQPAPPLQSSRPRKLTLIPHRLRRTT